MLTVEGNTIIIKFNKKFYKLNSIKTTKEIYQNICKTIIYDKDNYFFVELVPRQKELELKKLGLEFSNYVLSLQK